MVRVNASKQACPRGAANGDVAVSLSEGNAGLTQAGDIGSLSLGVSAKAFDVVIEVIADDQNHIGLLNRPGRRSAGGRLGRSKEAVV